MHLEFTYTSADVQEMIRTRLPRSMKKSRMGRGLFGWVLFIGLALMLFMLLQSNRPPSRVQVGAHAHVQDDGSPLMNLLVPLVPWLLIFGFIWFFVFRAIRGYGKRIWTDSPSMQQVQTIDVNEEGLRIANPISESFTRWIGFGGLSESKNLFVFFYHTRVRIGIPKRAINPAQLDEFRQFLRSHINAPISAFPVQPIINHPPRL